MTISHAQQQLYSKLVNLYAPLEISNITNLVLEKICGLKRVDRLINKNSDLTDNQLQLFNQYVAELTKNKPVQYVLNEAWFAGFKFYVDENVLIPRPETEELVEWVVEDVNLKSKKLFKNPGENFTIIDIGTGSGCIVISLKHKLPYAKLIGLDIEKDALEIAAQNANSNQIKIEFINANILKSINYEIKFNVIVSNPPYIPVREKAEMHSNVVLYEPDIALFVPDENPLLFYRSIIEFAAQHLENNGNLYFEIHENFGEEVLSLLEAQKFTSIEIKKDFQGKNRMIKGTLAAY